MTQLK